MAQDKFGAQDGRRISGKFRQLTDDFYVAPQLIDCDFADAKALGIKTVINNRPDGEEYGQLPHEDAKACAEAVGLSYIQVPVAAGGIFPDHIAAMREAVEGHEGPYLAYCRSGTRSCFLWSFVAAQDMDVDDILKSANQAGYDVGMVAGVLAEIRGANQD